MSQGQPPQYPQQYPPTSQPPPQQGYPPAGNYPPPPGAGGYPPGAPYPGAGVPMGTPKTSIAAVFSLVFGILGCIPLVTSILAVILGIVGIGATKNNQRSGRGMAIAGLLLGLLGVVLWSLFGGGMYTLWRVTGPTRAEGKAFIQNIADGKVDAAQAQCTSDITREELEGYVNLVKPLGALKDVTSISTQMNAQDGSTTSELAGAATFDKRPVGFAMKLVKQNGQWKIKQVELDPSGKVPKTSTLSQ